MNKTLLITLMSLISVVSFAQEDYNIESIERNISRSHDKEGEQAQEEYSDAMNEAYDTQSSPQINIYNANSNANKQNQKGEVDAAADANAEAKNDTKVQNDVALESEIGNEYVSRTNDIRNARKSLEVGTEQKTLEKIEWSRMEDEKDRADRLFGNRYNKSYDNDYKKEEPKVIVVEKPAYVAPVQQEPAYVAPVKPAPVYDVKATEYKEEKNWWGDEAYIAPMMGSLNYSADNVSSGTAYGVAIGSRFDSNVSIEGSFLYGELEMEDYNVVGSNGWQLVPGLKDVTQYGFGGAVKYNFGMGRFSPFIGALGSYTMREYTETRLGTGSSESTAFDAGLAVGADVKIAKNFSLGVEYRIMRNISNDRDEETSQIQQAQFFPQNLGKSTEPLEEVNQQVLLLNGKFSF